MAKDIFDYVTEQEALYKTQRVPIADGYEWNMYEHIRKSVLYKNSKYTTGADDGTRPYKNIILPIAKLAYRAEGFDVKDIELFIDDKDEYYKSFIARKYHDNWALDKHIDSFIDTIVTTSFDFGGTLVKKTRDTVEVVPLESIAFCDQTNFMAGSIGIKHSYSIEEMQEMKGIWSKEVIEEAIEYSTSETVAYGNATKRQTTSKNTPVYEVHGMFPNSWYDDQDAEVYDEAEVYSRQVHLITFVKDSNNNKKGITLFKGKLKESPFKFMGRGGEAERIFGRALNRGGIEELFDPQVWVNYSAIQLKEMLDTASLMILQTTDASVGTKNVVKELSQGEIVVTAPNTSLTQVNYQPINEASFTNSINSWENHARMIGSASEASLAVTPTSGTPFALEQLKTANGLAEHEYQRGIIADFVGEIYRDWVIEIMAKDMVKGKTWLEELSLSELIKIADNVVENEFINTLKSKLLNEGVTFTQQEADQYKAIAKDTFKKSNKKFIELLNNDIKGLPMSIKINVAGKQKYQSDMVNKMGNVFKTVLANPSILQNPQMANLFNQIIEASGMSPIDFDTMPAKPTPEQVLETSTETVPVEQA